MVVFLLVITYNNSVIGNNSYKPLAVGLRINCKAVKILFGLAVKRVQKKFKKVLKSSNKFVSNTYNINVKGNNIYKAFTNFA